MPKGKHISIEKRKEIVHLVFVEDRSPEDVWVTVSDGNSDTIQLRTIENICSMLNEYTSEEVNGWVAQEKTHKGGRPKFFSSQESSDSLLAVTKELLFTAKLQAIKTEFVKAAYGVDTAPFADQIVSNATISRQLRYRRWTLKVLSRKNFRADPLEQAEYLRQIAFVDPNVLINIDGMIHNADDFLARYGWAPSGEDARAVQLWINGKVYAIHAAYCRFGFIAWAIFEGTMTQNEVSYFINVTVKEALQRWGFVNSYCILDNASNQSTELVHNSLEAVFGERYKHLPAYTPILAPAEHGFANIRCYVQDHELEGRADPIGLIQQAFQVYSVGGERGLAAYNHFNCYDINHRQ